MRRKILLGLAILVGVYLAAGLAFHLKWESDLRACRELSASRGEMVDPPVFGEPVRLVADTTWWPVYLRANLHNFGMPFSTPCDHPGNAGVLIEAEGEPRYT